MITVKCKECGKSFEAKRTTAKFCSTNCRVKFNNKSFGTFEEQVAENKIFAKTQITPLLKNSLDFPYYTINGEPTDKAAGEPVTVNLTKNDYVVGITSEFDWKKMQSQQEKSYFDADRIKKRIEALSWVKEIEEYCQNAGITPQVLIECHRHQNKPQIAKKQGNESKIKESPMSDFRKNLVHHKTGYKGK